MLTALIKFQNEVGLNRAQVMRDDHFKHERRIVKRYILAYFCLMCFKVLLLTEVISGVGKECASFCVVVLWIEIGVGLGYVLYVVYSVTRL